MLMIAIDSVLERRKIDIGRNVDHSRSGQKVHLLVATVAAQRIATTATITAVIDHERSPTVAGHNGGQVLRGQNCFGTDFDNASHWGRVGQATSFVRTEQRAQSRSS